MYQGDGRVLGDLAELLGHYQLCDGVGDRFRQLGRIFLDLELLLLPGKLLQINGEDMRLERGLLGFPGLLLLLLLPFLLLADLLLPLGVGLGPGSLIIGLFLLPRLLLGCPSVDEGARLLLR